jgi:hypothetical protein
MGRQGHHLTVARNVAAVVDQHAYANTAFRRVQDPVHEHLAGLVVLNGEVLEIERVFCRGGQLGSQQESVYALRYQPESGQSRMRARLYFHLLPETGRFRMCQRGRLLLGVVAAWHGRAPGE